MITAMKSHDTEKVGIFRYLLSQFKNQEINLRRSLNSEEEIKFLQSEAKKRKESIEAYKNGNRPELAAKEQKELDIIAEFLPKQMSDEELKKIIAEVISQSENKDFGSIMKLVMSRARGLADGSRVSTFVRTQIFALQKSAGTSNPPAITA